MPPVICISMTANVTKVLEKVVVEAGDKTEICGLLAGLHRQPGWVLAVVVYPLSNLSLRKHSFAVDVEEFCRERDAIEEAGLVPIALYHSHLDGSTKPSFRDRELPGIIDLPLLIMAWDDGKLRFECCGDVDGRIVAISVLPYHDPEAGF